MRSNAQLIADFEEAENCPTLDPEMRNGALVALKGYEYQRRLAEDADTAVATLQGKYAQLVDAVRANNWADATLLAQYLANPGPMPAKDPK